MTSASLALWIGGIVALVLIAWLLSYRAPRPFEVQTISARVRYVIDGDTFELFGNYPRIRLFGVDAPEMKSRGGSVARAQLAKLIQGRSLDCQIITHDKYGRIVARCTLPGGADIGKLMIESGFATEYCRYSKGFYGGC